MTSDASAPASIAEPGRRPPGAGRARSGSSTRLFAGGTDGNERLTVLTGSVLVVLTAAVGVTIIRIGQLMWWHLFLGLVLVGPVALKLAGTGYRFVRYYTHAPAYRRKGPPLPWLRGLAPLVVGATIALFATGFALLFAGPNTSLPLGTLHKASFIAWIALTALHVLGHLPELVRALPQARQTRRAIQAIAGASGPPQPVRGPAGGGGRGLALGLALTTGVVLAVALIGQFSIWTR